MTWLSQQCVCTARVCVHRDSESTDVRDGHRNLSGDEGGAVCGTAVGTFLTLSREAVCHSSLEGVRKSGDRDGQNPRHLIIGY